MQKENPKSTVAPKAHCLLLGNIHCLFRYATDAVLSSWWWGFNLLLLRLHDEISLSFLCSHSSWGSALVLALPLCVGCPQASVPHPDRGLKQQLIRALLLTQTQAREGYGIHNWNAGRACSSRGHHDIATAWGTLCVPPVMLSLDHGPWHWLAAQASRGLRVLTCACTQDSWWQQWQWALAVQAHLWDPSW